MGQTQNLIHYIIPSPKFQKLGKFQGSDKDKKEKYLALDFGIFWATLRLNQNIFIINEVRLSSGKVLKGGVEGMGRYELELNELIDRFMRLC